LWNSTFTSSPYYERTQLPPAGLHNIRPLVKVDLLLQSFVEAHIVAGDLNLFFEKIFL
jgi:hypothetical protein